MTRNNEKIKVLMVPCRHEYVRKLKEHLKGEGVDVRLLKPFHYSTPLNILKILLYRSQGYRIIHVHWLYVFPFAWTMRLFSAFCRGLGFKIVWEMHNIVPHRRSSRDIDVSKWFYNNCDAVIFHSRHDIKRSKEVLGVGDKSPSATVYHANFIGSYKNEITKYEARKALGVPPEGRVLLCFGQIRKNRGYEHLVKAMEGLKDVTVVVAGEVIDRKVYRELLKAADGDRIRVFGKWIPDDEVQVYFNACDAVVLPYTEITTSGVVPLAYSFSRPVIVSDIGGLSEIVTAETGILVRPGDAKGFRDAVNGIFKRDFVKMGEDAFAFAKAELAWANTASSIKRLYREVSGLRGLEVGRGPEAGRA